MARRALNSQKRRFPARAVKPGMAIEMLRDFDAHDAPCLDVYTNQVLPLPGGGHYLMFPSFFEHFPEFLPGGKRNDGLWSE